MRGQPELHEEPAPLCLSVLAFLPPGSRYIPPAFPSPSETLDESVMKSRVLEAPAASPEMGVVALAAGGVLAVASVGVNRGPSWLVDQVLFSTLNTSRF